MVFSTQSMMIINSTFYSVDYILQYRRLMIVFILTAEGSNMWLRVTSSMTIDPAVVSMVTVNKPLGIHVRQDEETESETDSEDEETEEDDDDDDDEDDDDDDDDE